MLTKVNVVYSGGSVGAQLEGYPTIEGIQEILDWCKEWIPPKAVINNWRLDNMGNSYSFNASWRGEDGR